MSATAGAVAEPIDVAQARRGLVVGRAYYFVFFFGVINFVAFVNVHLQNLGISGTQIGIINAITFVISMFAPPLFGAIADRWQIHRAVLVALAFLTGVSALGFLRVTTFVGVLAAMIAISVFRLSIPSILDTSVMALVARANTTYAKQRVWGSVGFAAGSYLTGLQVARMGLTSIFWSQFVLMGIVAVVISLLMPVERATARIDYAAGLRRLTRVREYRAILVLGVTLGLAVNANTNFIALHILSLGGAAALVGLAFTIGTLFEIPTMFTADRWIYRFGLRKTLVTASLGSAVAWLLVALAFELWMIPLALAISGVFSALIWAALIPYTVQHTPAGMAATSLGISGAAFTGAGFAIGALLGGLLWDSFGGSAIYFAICAITVAGTLYFAWATRETHA